MIRSLKRWWFTWKARSWARIEHEHYVLQNRAAWKVRDYRSKLETLAALDRSDDYTRRTGHVREECPGGDACPINNGRPTCVVCDLFICARCGEAEAGLADVCPGSKK